jgi:hypothetical protein
MTTIIGPLPNVINPGDLAAAGPVMSNFNWIVNQVNANTPSSNTTQWVTFGSAPTFVSPTSFSVTADVATDLHVGRRVRCTINAGYVYATLSTIITTGVITFTLSNASGVLDATLSEVDFGIVSAINTSAPRFTDVGISFGAATAGASGADVIVPISGVFNDALSEITTGAAGKFTAKYAGTYFFTMICELTSGAATTGIAGVTQQFNTIKNNVTSALAGRLSWPFADSLARTMDFPGNGSWVLAAGDAVQFSMVWNYAGVAPTGTVLRGYVRRVA